MRAVPPAARAPAAPRLREPRMSLEDYLERTAGADEQRAGDRDRRRSSSHDTVQSGLGAVSGAKVTTVRPDEKGTARPRPRRTSSSTRSRRTRPAQRRPADAHAEREPPAAAAGSRSTSTTCLVLRRRDDFRAAAPAGGAAQRAARAAACHARRDRRRSRSGAAARTQPTRAAYLGATDLAEQVEHVTVHAAAR